MEESLMAIVPKTDFEKLLFAEKFIKSLKLKVSKLEIKNGILKSDLDELEYRLKQENPTADKLHKYKVQIKNTRLKTKMYKRKYEQCNFELLKYKILEL